ncbi:hypothetical protein ABZ639_25215 [Saccharomonospora sp. NPDC006951]
MTADEADKTDATDATDAGEVADAEAEETEETEDTADARDSGAGRILSRRATIMAVLAAVIVLAVGVAVWSFVEAGRLSAPADNLAVADERATREVKDQVSAGLKAVLSYDYNNLARTERAAETLLIDAAVDQYDAEFAEVGERARQERIVRTSTVRSAGVAELSPTEATVLVFLDQQTVYPEDGNRLESGTAVVEVTARKQDGGWKIAELNGL